MPASAQADASLYRGHRYPSDIIGHAVWLYFRFSLRLRDVEELLAERGVTVSYEAIREWCAKSGPTYALQLRRRRPRPSDKCHLDEVLLKIKGKRHWLWRGVDKHGVVLDILVQQRRSTRRRNVPAACARSGGEPATGSDHRQPGQLSARASTVAQHRASTAQGTQQPSRKLASPDAST